MYLERYPYKIDKGLFDYTFTSIGPKGHVRKMVRFTRIGLNTYNLAFGDFDESKGGMNDLAKTDNNDSNKILATVAAIAQDFTIVFPDVRIMAKGSTHSRTRLYRMGITKNWGFISTEFEIYGYIKGRWELFEFSKDYDGFLVHRK